MEASDLMIGDWIMFDEFTDKSMNKPVRIARLDKNNPIDRYYPISLTPEILEKNGIVFDKVMNCWNFIVYDKGNRPKFSTKAYKLVVKEGFLIDMMNFVSYRSFDADINYVHELQHALKLCKIDKEIEL